jgi:hypothetical protein
MHTMSERNLAGIPIVSYDDFRDSFHWKQSQHITMIGTTGCGKTTLELDIMDERDGCVAFIATKPKDETQDELAPLGFRFAQTPRDVMLAVSDRWIFHPGFKRGESAEQIKIRHRKFYQEILQYLYEQGNWAVILDEGRYVGDFLKLTDQIQLLYLQGRSGYNSVLLGTQRPRYVPLESFDQATHLFFFKDSDLGNIKRISELAGIDRRAVLRAVPELEATEDEGGQFLYYNTRTGKKMISKVEL